MTTTTTAPPAGARALLPLLACAALADLGAAQMNVNAMLAALSGNPGDLGDLDLGSGA